MSPKIKYDVTGIDSGGDFKTPTPGAYQCEIDVIEHRDSKAGNPMLEVQYVIMDGEFKNSRLWDYIVLDGNSDWKLRGFLEAVGEVDDGKEKGELDVDALVGKRVLVRTTNETSEDYGTRARVKKVVQLKNSASADEDDIDGDGDEGDYDLDDIMGMKKVELRDLIKEEELGIRVTKQSKLNTLRERVAEALGLADEEEGEEEEDDELEEVEDYAELPVDNLRNECKERGLNPKGTKKALVKRLEENDEEEGDEPF